MVLEARDYGFIRLKLKDLIFMKVVNSEHARMNIHRLGRKVVKEMGGGWRLTS